jgi:hypothetical protein
MDSTLEYTAKLLHYSEPKPGAWDVLARGAFKLVEHSLHIGRCDADARVRNAYGPTAVIHLGESDFDFARLCVLCRVRD